jgi:signal peptidase
MFVNPMDLKKMFMKFWKSNDSKVSLVRDVVVALLAVFIILMILWGYTGQWLAAPMVAIESGSMEHPNSPFGRLGTIDAGDMVLIQKVSKFNDVVTYAAAKNEKNGWSSYGKYGDVIIYKPLGRNDVSQIIHRAMCWVEVSKKNGVTTYTIADFGVYNKTSLTVQELGLYNNNPVPPWTHSGYLTKGDNNDIIDQMTSICPQPIQLNWISGKARSEIPWLGTINLFFEDVLHGKNTVANVHPDSLICLAIVIAVLISIPIALDVYDYLKKRNKTP